MSGNAWCEDPSTGASYQVWWYLADEEGNCLDDSEGASEEDDSFNRIDVTVPYPHLAAAGQRALDLTFRIAAHLRWRVYDPQLGEYLERPERGLERQQESAARVGPILKALQSPSPHGKEDAEAALEPDQQSRKSPFGFLSGLGLIVLLFLFAFFFVRPRPPGDEEIHRAARVGSVAVLKSILDRDPSALERPDGDGLTPLHLSAASGRLPAVRLLLERGANTEVVDRRGRTPLELARQKRHLDVVDILQAAARTAPATAR